MLTSEAAAAAGTAAAAPEAVEVANHLKRKSSDIGWEWGRLCDPNDKNKVKCLLCGIRVQELIALSSTLLTEARLL